MTSAQQIEIALRAGKVAKAALEFIELKDSHIQRIQFKLIVDELNGLRECLAKSQQTVTTKFQ